MKFSRPASHQLIILIASTLFLAGLLLSVLPVKAQTFQVNPTWEYPSTIPGLHDSGLYPVIIADEEGTLHVFHSQPVAGSVSIFYIRWSPQNGWSTLVDIINSPRGDARVFSGIIDQEGWIHLLFWDGDELNADIYYTRAPVINAEKSTSWSEPILIGQSALDPPAVGLAIDSDGTLVAVYSGSVRGNGLYVAQSQDNGITWSSPEPMFLTYKTFWWPAALQLYTDPHGRVFATWSVADASGNGQAVYFSKRSPTTQQWAPATLIADAIGFEADTPSIIKYNDNLMLVYHNNEPTTRWMRVSADNGETWTQPVRLFDQVGSNGAAAMVIDGNNTLHMFFGNRVGMPAIHGAWHSQWLGEQWSKPEPIVSGPQVPAGAHGTEGFDPSFLQATVIRGNMLFIIWRHDPQAGPTNIWYSYKTVDAPQQPITPLPTIEFSTPTTTPNPGESPTGTPPTTTPSSNTTYIAATELPPSSKAKTTNPNVNILVGIVPVTLLIFALAYWKTRGK
jgi:hypothetical protein